LQLSGTNGNFGGIIFERNHPILPKTELTPSLFQGGTGWVQLSSVPALAIKSIDSNFNVNQKTP
jgi:hypothetical protein